MSLISLRTVAIRAIASSPGWISSIKMAGGISGRRPSIRTSSVGGRNMRAAASSMEARLRLARPVRTHAVLHGDVVAAFVRLFPLWVTLGAVMALIYPAGLRLVSRVRADHAGAADHHARHGAHARAFRFFPRFSHSCAHPLGSASAVYRDAAARLGCGLPVSTPHRVCRRLGVGLLLSRRNGFQRDRLLGQGRRRAFRFDDRILDDARRCVHAAAHDLARRQPSRRRRLGPVSQHRKGRPASGCARAFDASLRTEAHRETTPRRRLPPQCS